MNQITGERFEFVSNGAMSVQWQENIREWVRWCRQAYPDQAKQEEQDPKVRAQLLEDALASAKRASVVDPSAQLLADQIVYVQMEARRAE